MTNEKAIEILQSGAGVWPITDRANNAINKAIKALSQQTEDAISRILVQEEISKSITLKENPHQIWQRIQDLPSVTPKAEPCEDAISRQATLEPYKVLNDTDTLCVALIRANIMQQQSVNPQEPSNISNDGTLTVNVEDGRKISRVLVCGANHWGGLYYPDEQEPKTGHWIYDRRREWDGECKYECSECGMGSDVDYAYCMRCGAKMIEPQESEGAE